MTKCLKQTMLLVIGWLGLTACSQNIMDEPSKEIQANKNKQPPNILWIITDDHRPDSIRAYNRAVYNQDESPLGYVESPNTDRLAAQGVMFTNAFANSPVCAPSRASMHSGRYPFRQSRLAFEMSHQGPDFVKPLVSQHLKSAGYGAAVFGKDDHYVFRWGPGQGFYNIDELFDTRVHFKHDIQKYDQGDIYVKAGYGKVDGKLVITGLTEVVKYADGTTRQYHVRRNNTDLTADDLAQIKQTDEEFDILRAYTRGSNKTIIGGVNPNPKNDTIDAKIVRELRHFLQNENQQYNTLAGHPRQGVDSSKPLFLNLGLHLPHTPVLPPKSIRERFSNKKYKLPEFDEAELNKLPLQLQKIYRAMKIDGITDEEKQQAIQDYYAFAAHGDELVGEAVNAFKDYSRKHNQDWVIIYTIGDHGWHLGENGIAGKTGPWQQSVANAVIMAASDKSLLPQGTVNQDLVEFVDFAPTMMSLAGINIGQAEFNYLDGQSLIEVANGKALKREYILGETSVVSGPRAYLHSKRFRFSMRTRPYYHAVPDSDIGKNIKWGLEADDTEVDMALYDLAKDPLERNNLAYDPEYKALAKWFRQKLGHIVLGDGRVEADWSQENHYVVSDFAKGADDKQLNIPQHLIPIWHSELP
ncbi:sulfatase-like hydrolase/transferase [Catenovulum adriaticum]|uniref:Sulfatase-like hydrolase/transferase n=1 Tax=Catenovulum adriaticum TaxID=2984846 RepID=A0ABY7AT66_9ALTE|nr:sulfatase-like hydrolase/transferase [Catenovulum sp. TS8]WAJ71710.1 sulfatase-like hydrolase/transferase [Catenovulum sp. TS8]